MIVNLGLKSYEEMDLSEEIQRDISREVLKDGKESGYSSSNSMGTLVERAEKYDELYSGYSKGQKSDFTESNNVNSNENIVRDNSDNIKVEDGDVLYQRSLKLVNGVETSVNGSSVEGEEYDNFVEYNNSLDDGQSIDEAGLRLSIELEYEDR